MKAATNITGTALFTLGISIHAAREGGDFDYFNIVPPYGFQSTPPVKAATVKNQIIPQIIAFQSTPPVKAATLTEDSQRLTMEFQSTPPVKAATEFNPLNDVDYTISIHAAREGGDVRPIKANKTFAISIHAAREGGDL